MLWIAVEKYWESLYNIIFMVIVVLSQVKSFLPQLEMANQDLLNKPAEDLDIENVSNDQDNYIEMVWSFLYKRVLSQIRSWLYAFHLLPRQWCSQLERSLHMRKIWCLKASL